MLAVNGVGKDYGTLAAIGEVSFELRENEFLSVVGPSGCGKTTLLKCISGLLEPTRGEVLLDGKRITSPPPQLALVFQDYSRSLFPWLRVGANVSLPLRKKFPRPVGEQKTLQALGAVGLANFIDHYPWQLSGGMQQRVAIARALAYSPKILILDEPFASVDAQTREDLEDLVLRLRRDFSMTILLVTHDIDEAVYMSDRIVVLTKQPSVVQEQLSVGLPWPRDQVTTKAHPAFADMRGHLYRAIRQAHTIRAVVNNDLAQVERDRRATK